MPIVLAGDDITVLAPDRCALAFAANFLRVFEKTAAANPVLGPLHLTVAAGVALVKRSYPFSNAYNLAEALCANAKKRSRRWSMLDFHVLHDTTVPDLEAAHAALRVGEAPPRTLTARPYRVTNAQDLGPPRFEQLEAAVDALVSEVDGERLVPRVTAVGWRDRLHRLPEWAAVEKEVAALEAPAAALLVGGRLDLDVGGGLRATLLWDALDAAEFLGSASGTEPVMTIPPDGRGFTRRP